MTFVRPVNGMSRTNPLDPHDPSSLSTSLSLAQATAKLESLAADCAALDARLRDAPSGGGGGGGGGAASTKLIFVSIATQLAAAESSRLLDEVGYGFRSRWWRVA